MPGRNQAGFTLLEVIVVIAIMGVAASVALPPLLTASRTSRLEVSVQQLIGDLRVARTEAIRRNAPVYVARTGGSTYHVQHVGHRSLPDGVTFQSGPDTVRFAAFGPVLTGAATYSLLLEPASRTVRVTTAGIAHVQ
jgi:prepilin-type N-terminal cleavage/methylation domain-containing protein